MVKEAIKTRDSSEDATILARAAIIIRDAVFNHKGFQLTGGFPHFHQA